MTKETTFDESLGKFSAFIHDEIGGDLLEQCVFLREAAGALTCIVPADRLPGSKRRALSDAASALLSPYAENDGFAVAEAAELFDESLNDESAGIRISASFSGRIFKVRLLDRRVMGGAWLQKSEPLSASKRLVFASLKGGVGRSTALCVLAADLAAEGHRVLAIDMDVEAPGIGSMLLDKSTLPRFGLLDYLVESGLQQLDDSFYRSLIGPSWLTSGHGVVSVIPAIGASALAHPQNVLSKIARAYLNGGDEEEMGITSKMKRLLNWLDASKEFDIILLDARAGLHETTGSALLGLGGRVVLFGTDQKQTIAGFEILFSNLAMVKSEEWPARLTAVHAKASANPDARLIFRQQIQESFFNVFGPKGEAIEAIDQSALDGVFNIEWDEDADAISARTEQLVSDADGLEVTAILENEGYRDFDPLSRPDSLSRSLYESVYGHFLIKARELLELSEGALND